MKIGLLTFHRSYNYGAFTQCFSLSNRIQRELQNVDFEVIDYTSTKAFDGYDLEIRKAKQQTADKLFIRNSMFVDCQNNLKLSQKQIVSDDIDEIIAYLNDNYDAVIVGSDAVWNWGSRGFPNVYFLKDYKGAKFSYAASAHGLIYQNMTTEQKEYLNEAFSDFRYIGVRDDTTSNMVHHTNPNLSVMHNCDPTVFLDLSKVPCDMDMLKEKMIKRGVDFSKPLIGLMESGSLGYKIKQRYGDKVQLVSVYQPNYYSDVFLYDLTPYEWAHVFAFFKLTVTHFFHGTLLSLVNHTPVIPVEISSDFSLLNKTKIEDVMNRLNLSEWRFVFDYMQEGMMKKILRHLNYNTEKEVWNKIYNRFDDFIENDYSDDIARRIKIESNSAESFFQVLKTFAQ